MSVRSGVERARIGIALFVIVMIGVQVGGVGVLLPAQMADFDVDKTVIGTMFFAFSGGYVITASANGALLHWLGVRWHLVAGAGIAALAALGHVLPSSFVAVLAFQALLGVGMGMLDAALNSYLSTLDSSAWLLNLYHAFFGLGALAGPLLAAYLLDHGLSWRAFFAVVAASLTIDALAFLAYPRGSANGGQKRPRLVSALRLRIVLIVAAFLCVYVGIEASVGNWGFSFLTEERGQGVLAAGWVVSAYWLGIALGRLFVNVLAERIGMSVITLFSICIAVVAACALVIWIAPWSPVAAVGMALLGFFLGPVFPTTIAIVPRLVPAPLVATTIGVLAATSLAGAAALPWVVGASAQQAGLWLLLPWTAAFSVLLGLLWWRIAQRLH